MNSISHDRLNNERFVATLDSALTKNCRILINGATGWIGSNISETLLKIFGLTYKDNLLFTGSRDSTLNLQQVGGIKVNRWSKQVVGNFAPTHVIQLAFKTRDHVSEMSIDDYLSVNEKLIENALWMTALPSLEGFLHTSSGAALGINADDKYLDPYGYLKKHEEKVYPEACASNGKKYLGLRIWSTTGSYIKTGGVFAIESFITQAITSETIRIESPGKVTRSYADANELIVAGMLGLLTGKQGLYNSGGIEVEMGDLARLVASLSPSKGVKVVRTPTQHGESNIYKSMNPSVEQILTDHDLKFSNLQDQVLQTMEYLIWKKEVARQSCDGA